MESGGQGARWDGRAQAIQLGALLLFAILIINLSLFQVFVVPNQNSEIEFNHNENLQNDMVDIRNNVLETASTGASSPTSVKLGTQYPARTVFVNPANPSGSLRTESLGELKVLNAEATGEAGDYWDGSDRTFDTKSLVYQPSYNYYTNAPETVYENSVLYNRFDSGTELNVTGQQLVNGRTITLIALQGSASVSKTGSTTVETEPLSAPLRRLPLGRDGGPVTIEIPTQLSEDRWRTLLTDELDTPDDASTSDPTDEDYVTFLDCANAPPDPCGTLTLQMEDIGSENYLLRTGAVSVSGNTLSQRPQYVVRVSDQSASLETGAETSLTVEVRDQYNNPVSNVELTGSVSGSSPTGSLDPTTQTTDENGEATFEYTAPGSETTDTLILGFDGVTNPNEPEATEFNIKVENEDSGGGDSTAPRVTDVSANPSTIVQGESFDLTANFSDVGNGGSDILKARWSDPKSGDKGSLSASDGQFDHAIEGVETTVASTGDWVSGDHVIEITGTDTNENTWTTQVTVTVNEAGGGGSSGEQVEYVDGTGSASAPVAGPESRVDFNIQNTGSDDVTITRIKIESPDGSLAEVEERYPGTGPGQNEIYIDSSTPGYLESDYLVGNEATLSSSGVLTGGEQATVTVLNFINNGGNRVSAADKQLTVTLYFQDGSQTSFTFTPS
jgi:hypothetical protein